MKFDVSNDGGILVANARASKRTFKFDGMFTLDDDQGIVGITLLMFE